MPIEEEIREDMINDERMGNMLTVREVAQLLHIHPNTLRRWTNNGTIKAYRITRRGDRRFKREEIVRFLVELNNQVDTGVKPGTHSVNKEFSEFRKKGGEA
jgi:excisionase family DNA binding protein